MGGHRPPIRLVPRCESNGYFLAAAFLAGAFLAAAFLAGAFLATAFLAGAFFAGAFLAGAFLAAVATFPPWDSTLNQSGAFIDAYVDLHFAIRNRVDERELVRLTSNFPVVG